MKLTATQQRIYDELENAVNRARECESFNEYWNRYFADRFQENFKSIARDKYEDALNGIYCVYQAKHESLKKLETLGLVKIIDIKLNVIQLIEK